MADFAAMVDAQRKYFDSQATKPYEFRREQLKKLQGWMTENEQAILDALHEDLGKSDYEGYLTEVAMVKQELADALKHLRGWMKPKRARTAMGQLPGTCRVLSEPYGVVLIMSPWNYPFQLTLAPLLGALAAGNCAIVKPSAYSPATSGLIRRMAEELFPPELVKVVEGGRTENAALLEEHFDYIFFTGSPAVGRLVMEKASRHLTPVSLELGGKSPVIVEKSADVALTARRLAWGKCLNAGQTCVAPDYVLVDRSREQELIEALIGEIRRMYTSAPLASEDLPKIVNQRHFQRLRGLRSPDRPGGTENFAHHSDGRGVGQPRDAGGDFRADFAHSDLSESGRGHPAHPPAAPASGPVPFHPGQGRGGQGAGLRQLRRRLRQRYGAASGHLPHALRRRGGERHGGLSRPVELPHLLPRKEHPQALGQARYRPALRAIQGQNGQAEEADLRPISNPRCRRNGGGGASLFERVSAEIVGFVRVGNGANGKKTCLRIFRKFPRRETCRFPKERGEANRQT